MSDANRPPRHPAFSQAAIARALGVSQATVSNVLNNSGRVNEKTRKRIEELAREMNYRPNVNARALLTKRMPLVGVTCGSPTDSYEGRLLDALGEELDRHGYQMMLHSCRGTVEQMWEQTVKFVDHRVSGIIFQTPHPELYEQMRGAFKESIAMVVIGATQPGTASVGCDYQKAGRRIGEHLAAMGRKHIAINLTPNEWDSGLRYRSGGIKSVLKEKGLPDPVEFVVEGAYYATHMDDYGRVAARAVLGKHPETDAMVFTCDDIAAGAADWLVANGRRVPTDVALIGFNDVPMAMMSRVPLTTIHQPAQEYARLAVQMLQEQIDAGGHFTPTAHMVDCPLVVRQSSDASWVHAKAGEEAPLPVVRIGQPSLPKLFSVGNALVPSAVTRPLKRERRVRVKKA